MPTISGFTKIKEAMEAVYLIVDPGILKVICATVIANRFPRDPIWLMLVSPSSGGKTAFITALKKVRGYQEISELTPQTFISGQKRTDKENSLLMRLQRNDILVFKDFTTMLTMQRDARAAIMAQLREIYDQSYTKRFGNGLELKWEGKLGLLAGVTTAIYTSKQSYSAMGERFILYSFIQPDRELFTERSMDNANTDMEARRDNIQNLFHEYLDNEIIIPSSLPPVPKELRTEIIQLANLTTIARSSIQREWASPRKEIEYVHALEMPGRFATQLSLLVQGMMVMNNDGLLEEDKHIIYKICLDSIDQNRRLVLQKLTQYKNATTKSLATSIGYPTDTVHRWLEDVTALGLANRVTKPSGRGGGDQWKLKEKYRLLFSKFENIPMLSTDLIDPDAIVDEVPLPVDINSGGLPEETQEALLDVFDIPKGDA